ncbi:MAG: hypothetical protein RSD67_02430 [Oscillospiraceae bacterium]
MTERAILERLKVLKSKSIVVTTQSAEQIQKINDRKKRWSTYFRLNPEIYIEKKMGFHSFGYQNFSYHLMQKASQYIEVSTRGTGKSLRVIAWAVQRCLLYPNSKIGVVAVGASQANENFLTAFMQELVFEYSPFMKWLYEKKLITYKETDKGYLVTFWNNSIILFCPCINSTRGVHFDILIGEELRLIKKADWDSIAMPMLVPRRAGFRNRPEYFERDDLDEDTKVICITSNRYKNEWFNTMFNNTFVNYFKNTMTENRVFCCDIFLAISHGLKKASWFFQQQDEMDDLNFRMEILNESIGEVEGAYFPFEMFRKNQINTTAFYPPTREQIKSGWVSNMPKKDGETRLLFVDFAFANTLEGAKVDNDNTVIGCLSSYKKGDKRYSSVDYLETHSGGQNDNSIMRIRELFWDYQADYIVLDARNGGELNMNDLSKEFEHPYRAESDWDKRGFTVCNDMDLHTVSEAKVQDYRARCVDPNAVPAIIPITANAEQNSLFWFDLKKKLKNEEISFLIDTLEFDQISEQDNNFFKMTSEEKALLRLPYIQTMYLINEAINLSATWNNGLVKLSEKRNAFKDRTVALSYGSYIMGMINNKLDKTEQRQEFDISDYIKYVYRT